MSVEDAIGMIAKLVMLDDINETVADIHFELGAIQDTLHTIQESIERLEKAITTHKKKNL